MDTDNKKCWLIYRPVIDYEESLTPYLVCDTEEKAHAIVQELKNWLTVFAASLPIMPDDESNLSDEEKSHFTKIHTAAFDAGCVPYDLDQIKDEINIYDNNRVEGNWIDMMILPKIM